MRVKMSCWSLRELGISRVRERREVYRLNPRHHMAWSGSEINMHSKKTRLGGILHAVDQARRD